MNKSYKQLKEKINTLKETDNLEFEIFLENLLGRRADIVELFTSNGTSYVVDTDKFQRQGKYFYFSSKNNQIMINSEKVKKVDFEGQFIFMHFINKDYLRIKNIYPELKK